MSRDLTAGFDFTFSIICAPVFANNRLVVKVHVSTNRYIRQRQPYLQIIDLFMSQQMHTLDNAIRVNKRCERKTIDCGFVADPISLHFTFCQSASQSRASIISIIIIYISHCVACHSCNLLLRGLQGDDHFSNSRKST